MSVMTSRWWLPGALILAGTLGCGKHAAPEKSNAQAEKGEKGDEKGEAHVTVRTQPARKGTVAEAVEGLGRCEALPDHLAPLNPAVEGHVHRLLVKPGDPVKKGQPVVELDETTARADLAEKSATRDSLKAALALLKAPPRPEDRRASELAIEQARVAVERAKRIADRLRPLVERHEVSDQQLFEADQTLIQARLQQQAAEAQLRLLVLGPRPEAVAEAKAKIDTAEGALALSRAHLEYHTLRAPIDGVLDSLTCHPGQTIAIGTPVGEVVDTAQVFVAVWLPARSARSVRVDQPAQIRMSDPLATKAEAPEEKQEAEAPEAKKESKTKTEEVPEAKEAAAPAEKQEVPEPDPKDEAIPGKVAFVGRVADAQTGNLPIRVLVDNPKGTLTLGQTVALTITVEEIPNMLMVPAIAIYDEGEGPLFSVVREGQSVPLHPKEVGPAHGGWASVTGTDLKEGEPVIVEGGYHLPEKTPVKVESEKSEPGKAVAHVEEKK